jgi:hypothetical protein
MLAQTFAPSTTNSNASNMQLNLNDTGTVSSGSISKAGIENTVSPSGDLSSTGSITVTGYSTFANYTGNIAAASSGNASIYGGAFISSYGGTNSSTAITASVYGIAAAAIGDLSTNGTTKHAGVFVDSSGTADINYGVFINSASGATLNYALYDTTGANSYFSGNVGIGDDTPAAALTVGSGDKFQVDGSGNLTFNTTTTTINLAAATAGNTFNLKIPTLASGTCSSAAAEGLIIKDNGGTQRGHVCIDSGTPLLKFYANQFNSTSTDVAENYSTRPEQGLEAGDVVALDPAGNLFVKKAATGSGNAFGVISSAPGIMLSGIDEATGAADTTHSMPVALKGRVPVKVDLDNGPILPGDFLTTSELAGVATKATAAGMVIGRALDAYDGTGAVNGIGKIRIFMEVGYWDGKTGNVLAPQSTSQLTVNDVVTFTGSALDFNARGIMNLKFIDGIESISGIGGNWNVDKDGKLMAKAITTDMLTTKEITITADDQTQVIGESKMEVGNSSATITNPSIRANDRIFITFYGNTEGAWWISSRTDGAFTVSMQNVAPAELPFEYLVVHVDDKRTSPMPTGVAPPVTDTVAPALPDAGTPAAVSPVSADTTNVSAPAPTDAPLAPAPAAPPTDLGAPSNL